MSRTNEIRWFKKNWIMIKAHLMTIDIKVSITEEILKFVRWWNFRKHCEGEKT